MLTCRGVHRIQSGCGLRGRIRSSNAAPLVRGASKVPWSTSSRRSMLTESVQTLWPSISPFISVAILPHTEVRPKPGVGPSAQTVSMQRAFGMSRLPAGGRSLFRGSSARRGRSVGSSSRTQAAPDALIAVDNSDQGVEVVNQISQFVETEGADIRVVLVRPERPGEISRTFVKVDAPLARQGVIAS